MFIGQIRVLISHFKHNAKSNILSVADPEGAEGAMAPPGPVKIGHKKMATEGGRIDFMFLGPPYPAAGSATDFFTLISVADPGFS